MTATAQAEVHHGAFKPVRQEEELSVHDIAEKVMEEQGNEVVAATEALVEMAEGDTALYRALTAPALRRMAYEACRAVQQSERRVVWTPPKHQDHGTADGVQSLGAANSRLLDFPLLHGTRLKDAGKDEVLETASFYCNRGRDMAVKGIWLRRVAERMTGKKPAGKELKESDLISLRSKAEADLSVVSQLGDADGE